MGTAEEGLVESFPAGQGRSMRKEKSDSCFGETTAVTPYNLQSPPLCPFPLPPRWSSAWNLLREQPTMFTNGCRLVYRAKAGLTWTSGW